MKNIYILTLFFSHACLAQNIFSNAETGIPKNSINASVINLDVDSDRLRINENKFGDADKTRLVLTGEEAHLSSEVTISNSLFGDINEKSDNPPPLNQSPTVYAGRDVSVTMPTSSVTLTGTGSDPDGTIAKFQWTKLSGPDQFSITSAAQARTNVNNLVQGVYFFQLRATDNQGATTTDIVKVSTLKRAGPNNPPTANAGNDLSITLPTSRVTLTGTGTDPDGKVTRYRWIKLAGPNQFTIASPTKPQTKVDNLLKGIYSFELRVTDNRGNTDRDTVKVTVNAAPLLPTNKIPIANAGNDLSIALPTSSVTLTGTGNDPDGTITRYQWTKLTGPTQFLIVSPTQAQTRVYNLVKGIYSFELRVTDNRGKTDRDTVKVTVNAAPLPLNKIPIANGGNDRSITLPTSSVTLTGTGSDPDGTITGYQWTKLTGPTEFAIASATQPQTLVNNLVQGVYSFVLRVTDNQGAIGRDTVKVTVNAAPLPLNKIPIANGGNDRSITLPTSSVNLTGTGTDPDGTIVGYQWNKLTGPTQCTIVSATQPQTTVNNLVQGVYSFEMRVTDNQGAIGRDTVKVTVNAATPLPNQAPRATAGNDILITLPTSSVNLSCTGTDPDGTIAGYQWTKLSGPTQCTIVSATQPQTIANNLVQGVYSFEVRVTDNQAATGRDTLKVTVNATTPLPNQAPTATAGNDLSITLPTSSVNLTGTGNDPDGTIAGFQWTKLTGPTQFTIVSAAQGQTIVNNLVQGVYSFELRVTDNQGAIGKDTVRVTVNATTPLPNKVPTANAGTDLSITLPTSSVTLAGTGTDPDGTIAGYQWTKLTGPTQFTVVSATQPQTIVNNLVQGVYSFELRITDNQGAIGRDTVRVTVVTSQLPTNRGGYYASPTGTGSGTFASPFRIADFWKVAKAGDTLNLMDGHYTGPSSMITPPQNLSGTATSRITIRAVNDGNVDIDGERTNIPCKLEYNNYFQLEGFNAHHSPFQSSVIMVINANNNIFKRIIGWETSDGNVNIWNLRGSSNNLIEDCAGWGQARKIFGATQRADNNIFRRCFGRWEGSIVIGPKKVFTLSYNSYDNMAENCIGTWDAQLMPQTYTLRNYDYTINTDENNGSPTQYTNYQVHQPGGIFSNDGFDLGPTVPSDIANIKAFGCIAFLKQNQRYHNALNRGNAAPFAFNLKGIEMRDCISYIEPGVNHTYIQSVNFEGTGGTSAQNPVANLTRIGGKQDSWTIASSWSVTKALSGPDCSVVKANGGTMLNPKNPSGQGAVIEKRYVNGVLTNENLWPWPMNQRIIDAMIQGGYSPVDVTKEVFGLCGSTAPSTATPTAAGDIVAVAKKWLASTSGRDSLEAILDSWQGNIDSVIQKVKPVPTSTQTGEIFYQSFTNPLFRQRYPDHQYHMYVPAHYSSSKPIGVMIWMHGGGQWDATGIDHLAQYEMDSEEITGRSYPRTETDNSNYILVAPIAPFGPVIPTPQHASRWNVPNADQYLMDIITEISTRYNIDYNRIVVAGFSMGGIGAYHQALRLNDRLAAVMASGGSWTLGSWDGLKNMPMYIIHGVNDAHFYTSECRPHNTAIEYARLCHNALYKASNIHRLYEYPAEHGWDASGQLYWKNFLSGQTGWVTDKVRNPYRSNVTAVNPWRSYDVDGNFGVTWTENPSPHTMWVSIKQTGTGTIPYDYARETGTGGCSSLSDFNNWSLTADTKNLPGGKAEANITGPNQIVVTSTNVTKMSLWLHPNMVNFNNPVQVTLNGVTKSYNLKPSLLTALKSYERRWDWGMIYHAEIEVY